MRFRKAVAYRRAGTAAEAGGSYRGAGSRYGREGSSAVRNHALHARERAG